MKILLIKTNKESFHELEFVRSIENILKNNKIKFFTSHYKDLKKQDLKNADKIIICGTSLKDNHFLKNIDYFKWIENYNKPILGICSGMQIISKIFKAKLKHRQEIGLKTLNFKKEFLGLKNKKEVYELHNNYFDLPKNFTKFTDSKIPQAIKHNQKPLYGTLFHPEVRNKNLILEFCLF